MTTTINILFTEDTPTKGYDGLHLYGQHGERGKTHFTRWLYADGTAVADQRGEWVEQPMCECLFEVA